MAWGYTGDPPRRSRAERHESTAAGVAPSSTATTRVRCYDATGAALATPMLTFTQVTSDASEPC